MMLKSTAKEPCEITSGFNRCMDCGCEKFREGYTSNYCVCGHSYISHYLSEHARLRLCSCNLEVNLIENNQFDKSQF
jgi:hypothetical protein